MKKIISMLVVCLPIGMYAQHTPTMGWSSWNTFALDISESLIKQQADAMHNTGLQDAGYSYVNIDDGYWNGRGDDGHLRLNTERFPNGMRHLVDYIHSLGLKAGIYSDAGDNTCGSAGGRHEWGRGVGFAGYEEQDCKLYFDEWDFDFIKVDYCGGMHMGLNEREQYTKIYNAIHSCHKKDIIYNVCRWAFPGTWIADVSDSWRTTGDIYDAWKSVRGILAENLYLSAYCKDGHYNDMDMLEVGRSMTQTEDETHFGMWCIMSSPLLIGCDMANIRPQSLSLLCNKDLISLNQDRLHLQAYVVEKQAGCYVLVKDIEKLYGKTRAVAVYNPSDEPRKVFLNFRNIDLEDVVSLYDCIARKQLDAPAASGILVDVPAHGTRIMKVKAARRLDRKVYEAETAWLSEYQELGRNDGLATANYGEHGNATGGYVARYLGTRAENDIQWQNVKVSKKGTYRLSFTYFCGETRSFTVEVNGSPAGTLTASGEDWNRRGQVSVDVELKKGINSVRLYNAEGWMPDIDCMTIE